MLYVNKLRVAGLLSKGLNAVYESLFETGVDEMAWDDLSKNEMVWPRVEEVLEFRRETYRILTDLIASPAFDEGAAPYDEGSQGWALLLGFAHEEIHLETSSVLIRELPAGLVAQPEWWPLPHPSAAARAPAAFPPVAGVDYPAPELAPVEATEVKLGRPADGSADLFGWDNEFGARTVPVPAFSAGVAKVTNGEFWHFVSSGGYREERHWSEEGRRWRAYRNTKWPCFWVLDGPQGLFKFRLRTVFSVIDMQWDWPAVVNLHEAEAYCAWYAEREGLKARGLTARITAEAEHHALGRGVYNTADGRTDPVRTRAGEDFAKEGRFNLNLAYGSEGPVRAGARSELGFHDVLGNVWEWTADHFNPLPGFKVHPYYDDFSTPCFDGKHFVIMGGSFVSTGNEASVFSRYHFRPHFYQHAGFRVTVSASPSPAFRFAAPSAVEAGTDLFQALASDFVSMESAVSGFALDLGKSSSWPKIAAGHVRKHFSALNTDTVGKPTLLDVGCGIGGLAFALAPHFDAITAVDLNPAYVAVAKDLQRGKSVPFVRVLEGGIVIHDNASLPSTANLDNIEIRQMDALCLSAEFKPFDMVALHNILSEVVSPKGLLGRMCGVRGLVKPGGLLFIADTWDWNEARNPRGTWLGGYQDKSGKWVTSSETLAEILSEDFEKVFQGELPRIIVTSARQATLQAPQVFVWRRKGASC